MLFEKILFGITLVCLLTILFCRWVVPSLSKRELEPWYLDWARSLFPVFAIVFLLRGFVAEPFRIPSGSMLPTLEIGDFILVNKFTYGLRLPIVYDKVVEISTPERGDIVVFRYPLDNQTSYIKRLVGVPGDQIDVMGRALFVNGVQVYAQATDSYTPAADSLHEQQLQYLPRDNGYAKFSAIFSQRSKFDRRSQTFTVPEGQFFMMGDNRDNSADSRAWGMVPEENIVGKAFFVWMHYDTRAAGDGFDWTRIGTSISAEIEQSTPVEAMVR
ncbi:MAG TPA: signal peptidase I [Gammaproteobacteria bacterium]|jgi:signal peptidase I|nr:signal peptidase I [Gammaproteobacteria bacterium]